VTPFVFAGKKRIPLNLGKYRCVKFLYKKTRRSNLTDAFLDNSLKRFFRKNTNLFADKKICVVLPDHTREIHPRKTVLKIAGFLKKLSHNVDFMIALGLHRALDRDELERFLGKRFLKTNNILQHNLKNTKSLGRIKGVPASLNRKLFGYDILLTIGVVEPHLYAGFSGGVKCIAIGLAGKDTILHTHSVDYLSRRGVNVSNTKTNPFQKYLWALRKQIDSPIYSLNIINGLDKEISSVTVGEARESFSEATELARKVYAHRVKEKFDLLFVGCDSPKDRNLYQASRLFNYVLEKTPLVKKGGAVCVFATLDEKKKSMAEKNFENLLRQSKDLKNYKFTKQGEHRTFKVLEASQTARLFVVTPNIPKQRFSCISFREDYREVLTWAGTSFGDNLKIGIIPSGISFIPFS